jgi:hypothetical protein
MEQNVQEVKDQMLNVSTNILGKVGENNWSQDWLVQRNKKKMRPKLSFAVGSVWKAQQWAILYV